MRISMRATYANLNLVRAKQFGDEEQVKAATRDLLRIYDAGTLKQKLKAYGFKSEQAQSLIQEAQR